MAHAITVGVFYLMFLACFLAGRSIGRAEERRRYERKRKNSGP